MKIRGARSSDIVVLMKHGKEFYQHTRYLQDGLKYNPQAVGELCMTLITNGDAGRALVLTDDEEEVVGFVLLGYGMFPWDPSYKIAIELAYYVTPEHRNGKNARKLLQAAETVAKKDGIKYLTMVSMESCDPRRAEALYIDMAYVKTGTSFTKEL